MVAVGPVAHPHDRQRFRSSPVIGMSPPLDASGSGNIPKVMVAVGEVAIHVGDPFSSRNRTVTGFDIGRIFRSGSEMNESPRPVALPLRAGASLFDRAEFYGDRSG